MRVSRYAVGGLCLALALSFAGTVFAQAPAGAASAKKAPRIENLILAVSDLDKSVAFYTALGLEPKNAAGQQPRPPSPLNSSLSQLTNIKGASFRSASFKIPGVEFGLVLNEFTQVPRTPNQSHMQDPGALRIAISVHDLDAMIKTLKKLGGSVMSKNGVGIPFKGDNSTSVGLYAAAIRDPDGFIIEAMQYSPYRTHSRLALGVNEMFNSMRFYTEVFGFVIDPPFWDPSVKAVDLFWDPDPRVMDMFDTPNAPSRYIFMRYHTSADWFELMEFKNVVRKPFRPALSDPGAATLSLVVPDVDRLVKAVKSGGGTVVSSGGEIVKGANGAAVMVRDLDGFYLELLQAT